MATEYEADMYGYVDHGIGTALFIGVLIGSAITATAWFVIPWLWIFIKPWLHSITAAI